MGDYNANKITINEVATALEAFKPNYKGTKAKYQDSLEYLVEEMIVLVERTKTESLQPKSERVVNEEES